jgi:hypothetical protein
VRVQSSVASIAAVQACAALLAPRIKDTVLLLLSVRVRERCSPLMCERHASWHLQDGQSPRTDTRQQALISQATEQRRGFHSGVDL